MYDETIYLISKESTGEKDEYGDDILEIVKNPVFAEKKSVKRTEFYQAQSSGYKPEIAFELSDSIDYDGQSEIEYKGITYKVLRAYETGTKIEIICYGGIKNASAEKCNENQ